MNDSQAPTRYLRRCAAVLALAVAGTVALVVACDPYGLYRVVEKDGFNTVKPRPARHQNEIKLSQALRLRADTVILGNSRAEIGFDPLAPALRARRATSYNLAIPGTGIATARGQLSYLRDVGQLPRRIVVGIEFLDFIDSVDRRQAPATAPAVAAGHPVERYFWRIDSLFSLASLRDALRTPLLQREAEPESMGPHGFNPLLEYRSIARREGYERLFRQRAQENARVFASKASGAPSAADFAELDALLDIAARGDSELMLVVYPYHAQVLALFEAAGLWPAFEDWKLRIARAAAAARQRHPAARIAIFDFSGYGDYQCEAIPGAGQPRQETLWYWEGGHFKKALGDLVLARILPPADGAPATDEGFGTRLDEASVERNRRRIADERTTCAAAHPELFAQAATFVATARKGRPAPT